jgi:hypothetical protein
MIRRLSEIRIREWIELAHLINCGLACGVIFCIAAEFLRAAA